MKGRNLDTVDTLRRKLEMAKAQNEVFSRENIRLRNQIIDANNTILALESTVKRIVAAYGEPGLSDKNGETVAVCIRMNDKSPENIDSTEIGQSIIVEVW